MKAPDLREKPACHPKDKTGDRRQADQQPADPPFQSAAARRAPGDDRRHHQDHEAPATGHRKNPPLQHPPDPSPNHLDPVKGTVCGSAARTIGSVTFLHQANSNSTRLRGQANSPTRLLGNWNFTTWNYRKSGRSPVSRILSLPPLRDWAIISLPACAGARLRGTATNTRGYDGRATLPLFCLAPRGVCRAAPVTRTRGGLLPHPFTLTPLR